MFYPIPIRVVDADIEAAKAMRADRDKVYGNVYEERATDARWVGDLGEICFDYWLTAQGVKHEWITEEAAGKSDFVLAGGLTIGFKTVKRQVPVRPGYTAQVSARHVEEPSHTFFFACYEEPKRVLWLIGAITRAAFLQMARYYGSGEQVHANYIVREGHEIYNIGFGELCPPDLWLMDVKNAARKVTK